MDKIRICSWNNLSQRVQVLIEFVGTMVNHVKEFLVRELGKYFILKFSLFAISHASIRYLATCSTVDSLVSLENLVNLGTFHLAGNYDYKTYSDKGDV